MPDNHMQQYPVFTEQQLLALKTLFIQICLYSNRLQYLVADPIMTLELSGIARANQNTALLQLIEEIVSALNSDEILQSRSETKKLQMLTSQEVETLTEEIMEIIKSDRQNKGGEIVAKLKKIIPPDLFIRAQSQNKQAREAKEALALGALFTQILLFPDRIKYLLDDPVGTLELAGIPLAEQTAVINTLRSKGDQLLLKVTQVGLPTENTSYRDLTIDEINRLETLFKELFWSEDNTTFDNFLISPPRVLVDKGIPKKDHIHIRHYFLNLKMTIEMVFSEGLASWL